MAVSVPQPSVLAMRITVLLLDLVYTCLVLLRTRFKLSRLISGYDDVDRRKRLNAQQAALEKAFSDYIQTENAAVMELNAKVESQRRLAAEACQALGYPPFFPERGLTTIQLLQVSYLHSFPRIDLHQKKVALYSMTCYKFKSNDSLHIMQGQLLSAFENTLAWRSAWRCMLWICPGQ